MGSVIALIAIVVAAYLVVLAGGVAFEITGMDRDMARFQALSAFTGTGFTTRAAEEVVEHKVRRRIAMVLIVLGYAGAASVIATLLRSFDVDSAMESAWHISGGILFAVFSILLIRRNSDRLMSRIRRLLTEQLTTKLVPQEDLLRIDGGLGLTRVEVPEGSRVIGVPLRDLDLRAMSLSVLLIERPGGEPTIPEADSKLRALDHMVLFGRLEHVQRALAPEPVVNRRSTLEPNTGGAELSRSK